MHKRASHPVTGHLSAADFPGHRVLLSLRKDNEFTPAKRALSPPQRAGLIDVRDARSAFLTLLEGDRYTRAIRMWQPIGKDRSVGI
jgi:hypothetical protein